MTAVKKKKKKTLEIDRMLLIKKTTIEKGRIQSIHCNIEMQVFKSGTN